MTFKEKHLLPLALAATLTASCSDENGFFKKNEVSLGLLDERPLKEKDKYNTEVILYQIDIPLYNKNGDRLSGQYVLTRGLKKSGYKSQQKPDQMKVKPVYINDSPNAYYVKVDDNNAIYTECGFCGLFTDYNKKAVIVADNNISRFTSELNVKEISSSSRTENRKSYTRVNSEDMEFEASDGIDTLNINNIKKDTSVVDITDVDTAQNKSLYEDERFLDSLKYARQKGMDIR